MENILIEIEYYKKHPNKLASAKPHLISLYGQKIYEDICNEIRHSKLSNNIDARFGFRQFKKEVWKITELQPLYLLDNFDKRGFKNYHIDHIVSIWEAFKINWTPENTGDISNLRMLPYKDNLLKGIKSVYPIPIK